MFYHSVERLLVPAHIVYDQAILLAAIGLVVNLICAWWLKGGHHHGHHHAHDHHHHHQEGDHKDLNLRAAYLHVLADALTSLLAIFALLGGKFFGADWLDPAMGIVGSVLVSIWAVGLLRETGRALLDVDMDAPVVEEIHEVIAQSVVPAHLTDLHVWRVGAAQYACAMSVATSSDLDAKFFKQQLAQHEELVHITVEVNRI